MPRPPFLHRTQEITALNRLTSRAEPNLILVYGRRRVGKSTLLQHWATQTGWPTFYWESPRSTVENVRGALLRELYQWAGQPAVEARPHAADWLDVFRVMRRVLGDQPTVVILDEFPWAVEADPALPSRLKTAWDTVFADSQVKLCLAGSHISAMEKLLLSDAPLFGRLTGKLYVRPFSYAEIAPFLPHYDAEKRLAVYAILGGIPDYLRRWDDTRDLLANIDEIFLADTSPYRNEHTVLINDVLRRDSPDYEAILSAVGRGRHDLEAIAQDGVLPSSRVASVLNTLGELRLVERRLRASVPLAQHGQARHARYFLGDPFLRFYYRFVAPNRSRIAQGLRDTLKQQFVEQLRSFVGAEFENLCRAWVLAQAQASALPFAPDFVGSDWTARYQADVVAVNWRDRQLLIGEAKWGDPLVGQAEWEAFQQRAQWVTERFAKQAAAGRAKTEHPVWQIHQYLFTRRGVTAPVRAAAARATAQCLTFADLARDLAR